MFLHFHGCNYRHHEHLLVWPCCFDSLGDAISPETRIAGGGKTAIDRTRLGARSRCCVTLLITVVEQSSEICVSDDVARSCRSQAASRFEPVGAVAGRG